MNKQMWSSLDHHVLYPETMSEPASDKSNTTAAGHL